MPFGMGLNKNRHGTYEARKKVPRHLEEAVARVLGNGKPKQVWLKRSLATKGHLMHRSFSFGFPLALRRYLLPAAR